MTTHRDCIVVKLEEPALDFSSRGRVESSLRRAAPPDAPLVIDWSNVQYVERLGLETLFDFLIERKAAVAFCGVSREIQHLLWRMQILPLIPVAAAADEAAALIERPS